MKTVITEGGDASIGMGSHRGENRSIEAAKKAIKSPLLEDISIEGAKGALISISAGSNLTLFEANEAASIIQGAAGDEANIIFGTVIDESLVDEMRVTVIATGFYMNKEGHYEATEDQPAVPSSKMPVRSRTARPRGEIVQPVMAEEEEDTGVMPREYMEYPAILRKKMA